MKKKYLGRGPLGAARCAWVCGNSALRRFKRGTGAPDFQRQDSPGQRGNRNMRRGICLPPEDPAEEIWFSWPSGILLQMEYADHQITLKL
jgi:hypothetical protein